MSAAPPAHPANRWLPFGVPELAATRLFCFPHAGASAAGFAGWQRIAGSAVTICPVQPPGRAERFREDPYRNVFAFVDGLIADLAHQFHGRYALFGHSMGALVVFELARRLRRLDGVAQPLHVFVSGRPAPQLPDRRVALRELPINQLIGELRRIGGTPDMLLRDPELLEAFLPLMRADFAVNEDYRYREEDPMATPLTVFGGRVDPRADEAELRAWAAQTSGRFACHVYPGGHFFAEQHADHMLDTIRAGLSDWEWELHDYPAAG